MISYVSISRGCFDAVEGVLGAYSDSLTSQKEVDEALGTLERVWQAEKERKARSPQQVQADARERGSKPGRRAIDIPEGEELARRLKTTKIGQLARELGCSAPTIRERINRGVGMRARQYIEGEGKTSGAAK